MRVRGLLTVVFVALLLAPIADAQESVEFMSVAEAEQLLAAGPVAATFKSVPEGSTLREYDIVLRGIVSLYDIKIFVFTSKDFVVGGMSGSPVTVKGLDGRPKLLGALAYRMTDFAVGDHWGGISPIQYMHEEALGNRRAPASGVPGSFVHEGRTFTRLGMIPTTHTSGTAASADRQWPLAAGMPITMDLLEVTDAAGLSTTVSATGTITYISPSGELYAFGHPFMDARTARYNFRTCRIVGTIYSNFGSHKLSGERSPVMGTIDFDGAYGIYGRVGNADQRPVTEFSTEFSSSGVETGRYRVRMATTSLTPTIMGSAFYLLGALAKVPFPEQASTVVLTSTIELEGHEPVRFSRVFTSTQEIFGARTIYNSSYQNAYTMFLEDVYVPLTVSRFKLKVGNTHASFEFSDGVAPSLKVARAKFPSKITWGEDPVLDLLLVSEDNTITLSRHVKVPFDWDKIEKPVYTTGTKDTEKQEEKVVGGVLSIYTASVFSEVLSDNEKEVVFPLYFLDAKNYLDHFRQRLERGNRMLYARATVRKRSGVDDASPESPVPAHGELVDSGDGWVIGKGLNERRVTVEKEKHIRFPANLPPVPPGYMVATIKRFLPFEIVK